MGLIPESDARVKLDSPQETHSNFDGIFYECYAQFFDDNDQFHHKETQ